MKVTILALGASLAVVLAASAVGGQATAQTTAKPGLKPGTLNGKGTIAGTTRDGRHSSTFRGALRFTLEVDERSHVAGSGSWTMRRFRTDDAAAARVKGWAAIAFDGEATNVTLAGTQYVIGEALASGTPRPIRFENELDARLVIAQSGRCKVSGRARPAHGVMFAWSATLKGDGCGV
jgi:hypothetical protein